MLQRLSIIAVFGALILAACGGPVEQAPVAPAAEEVVEDAMEEEMAEEAMDEEMADDEMAEDAHSDDEMAEDAHSDDAMMEDGEMAEDEKADDAMMEDGEMAEDEKADDAMMEDGEMAEDEKADDAMMEDGEMAEDEKADDAMMEDGEMAEDEKADDAMMEDGEMMEDGNLAFVFSGLEDLGPDYVYEGWLIVDGAPVTAGRFTVDADGVPSATSYAVADSDLEAATAYVLTIEPAEGDDPAPSAVHVVAGDFADGGASLDVSHPAALNADFSDISGSYILAAPSAEEGTASYVNGIWFLDPSAGPAATLNLPELPEGWVYEGWIANADGPISTGTFSSVEGADSDGAGPTGGPLDAPPFPGQDFVDPAIDLTTGYAAVISIEPVPDNSPAPFAFKPLVDANIDDTGEAGVLQDLGLNLGSFVTGYAGTADAVAALQAESAAMMADGEMMEEGNLTVDFAGLEDLGPDYVYEGWLIVNNAPITAGRFSVDADGNYPTSFALDQADVDAASSYVLTIEPAEGDDPAPSAVHIIAGNFEDGSATLTIDHPAALGTDFSGAAGSTFILGVPTADDAPYQNGIWFTGITLPDLPNGWVYEGWVVGPDGPVTTGTFRGNKEADSDGGGPAAGPIAGPAFAGSDFVDPATNLIGYTAVISVEPDPDNSPAPFTLKPLVGPIADAGDHVDQDLAYSADSFPTGTASR